MSTLGRLFLWFSFAVALAAAEAESPLDRWFAVQTKARTWSADFVQTRSLKALTEPLISRGKVWVMLPDRFRWELGQPAQTIALRQPDQLMVIYPRLKRAEKYPLHDQRPGPWRDALVMMEAGFPRSQAELESHFRLLASGQTNELLSVALQPKTASARRLMSEIHLTFRTNDFSMTSMELRFGDGSSLRNDFTNAILDAPLDPARFQVELGRDFTVVEPLRP